MYRNPLVQVNHPVLDGSIIVEVTHDNIKGVDARRVAFHFLHHRQPTSVELSNLTAIVTVRTVPQEVANYILSVPSS